MVALSYDLGGSCVDIEVGLYRDEKTTLLDAPWTPKDTFAVVNLSGVVLLVSFKPETSVKVCRIAADCYK